MVVVAQMARALDCGSRGRVFEPRLPPRKCSCNSVGLECLLDVEEVASSNLAGSTSHNTNQIKFTDHEKESFFVDL